MTARTTPSFALRLALCLGAGAFCVLGQAPWNFWFCTLAGLGLFYTLLSMPQSAWKNFLSGWCFGFGYFGTGLWWIANALLVEGNEFRWVWPLAIAGLPALLAFFPALACVIAKRFFDLKILSGFAAFLAAMALSEWLRGHIFTGFPWNLYGYIWSGWPGMMQIAALGGSYFLTLLTFFLGFTPAFLVVWRKNRLRKFLLGALALLIFVTLAFYGHARLKQYPYAANKQAAVRLVQANITQEDKWDPAKAESNLQKMVELSALPESEAEAPVTFIVWPETAIYWQYLESESARGLISRTFSTYKNPAYLLTGIVRSRARPEGGHFYYNSLAVLDRDLNVRGMYDKSHLVPFGEYIPLQEFIPLKPFVQFEGFTPGDGPSSLTIAEAPPFSPLICYEVIFPGRAASRGNRPEWLVNVTNDAWYGDSPGPRQHFAQTRFRAIEEGLPLVRVANTGITGVVDSLGRPVYATKLFEMAGQTIALPAPLPPTPYVRFGEALFFATSAALMACAVIGRRARSFAKC